MIVATPDWEAAAAIPTVIDADEYEIALNDPLYLALAEEADKYLASVEKQQPR